jgi:hypothetical protein
MLIGHQKARGRYSGVSAFKGYGRDEPGMGNESRMILVFCFFLRNKFVCGAAYGV